MLHQVITRAGLGQQNVGAPSVVALENISGYQPKRDLIAEAMASHISGERRSSRMRGSQYEFDGLGAQPVRSRFCDCRCRYVFPASRSSLLRSPRLANIAMLIVNLVRHDSSVVRDRNVETSNCHRETNVDRGVSRQPHRKEPA
jgi:hypothetical protein